MLVGGVFVLLGYLGGCFVLFECTFALFGSFLFFARQHESFWGVFFEGPPRRNGEFPLCSKEWPASLFRRWRGIAIGTESGFD